MCTLTWWQGSGGRYEVFFNRDELKNREIALPPRELAVEGVRVLAPIDPRGGGTWLAANEHGIVVALLNWYGATTVAGWPARWGSRGALVMALAASRNRAAVREHMRKTRAEDYPPFRLVAFTPGDESGAPVIDGWQGSGEGDIDPIEPRLPLCSSSFETESVIDERRRLFRQVGSPSPETLWAYHHGSSARPTAWTVRMHRPDAQTWSISRITVSTAEIRFVYEAESPGLAAAAVRHEAVLPRKESQR